MRYKGSCHCGQVAYEVEGSVDAAITCNCSICQRKGSMLWFVPKAQFTLLTPDENAADYQFNKHRIHHRFCRVCGIHPYGEGVDSKGNAMAAINLRCLDDFDLASVPVHEYDGRSA